MIPLPPDLRERCDEFSAFALPAHATLFEAGSQPSFLYWLEQGLLRAYFVTPDGKEFTKEFYWEGDAIVGMRSLLSNEPLPYAVVTLEACRFLRLPVARYRQFVDQDAAWHGYHQVLVINHLLIKERKEEFLLLQSPEQRVAAFLDNHHALAKRLPDYLIASYLAMTPISYSRIKKRLGLLPGKIT